MAHTKSAKKKIHQYRNNQLRNSAAKSLIKTSVRKLVKSVEVKEEAGIKSSYAELCSALDKAAKKGSITKQTAIRRKARAAARLRAPVAAKA
jgi:small subunit ribosomal protein S20